jgi:hypothetical protein
MPTSQDATPPKCPRQTRPSFIDDLLMSYKATPAASKSGSALDLGNAPAIDRFHQDVERLPP